MQTPIDSAGLMAMASQKRAQLINSIGGFKSVCLIGTIDNLGNTNLAIFSSIVHIGANPPLIGFIIRPDIVERHSLSNILDTGCYTINHLNNEIYKQAHQTSARYAKNISEFDAVNLTKEFKNNFTAPFVKESSIQFAVEFKERINLSINNTILVIGEITELYFPGDCLCDDGYVDIEKAGSLSCSGLDSYHTSQRIGRLSYAKPDVKLDNLK